MKRIVLLVAVLMVAMASWAHAWSLAWDLNPAPEGVVEYRVYQDGMQVGSVPAPPYDLGPTLPEACWQVSAVNGYGIESDLSAQVCVGRPSGPSGQRIAQ